MRKQHTLFLLIWGLALALFPARPDAAEPALSLTGGISRHTPHDAPGVHSGGGFRGGFTLHSNLPAGTLLIPMEWGFALRTASLRFEDSFDRVVFTDLEVPILFHGDLFGLKYVEPLAIWTPSYTLDMVSKGPDGAEISNTDGLRTRFNMGFGGGVQAVYRGFRLRAYAAYNIFPPITGAEMTYTDWVLEAAIPLFWKRGNP